jgi:hypothetical protein
LGGYCECEHMCGPLWYRHTVWYHDSKVKNDGDGKHFQRGDFNFTTINPWSSSFTVGSKSLWRKSWYTPPTHIHTPKLLGSPHYIVGFVLLNLWFSENHCPLYSAFSFWLPFRYLHVCDFSIIMDNTEKLTTLGTQEEQKHNRNTTQYVLDTTMHKQTVYLLNEIFYFHILMLHI